MSEALFLAGASHEFLDKLESSKGNQEDLTTLNYASLLIRKPQLEQL